MIHYNERLEAGQKIFWSAFIFTFLITFFSSPSPVSCKEYEAPQNQRVSDIFPAEVIKGPHYRIRDQVVSYGYMRHYIVDSDFGVFEVTGDGALRKLLKEIQAIAILKEVKESKAFGDSVKKAVKKPIAFGKNLIENPTDTLSGIPKGVNRLFENIETSITKEHDPSEDARTEQALQVSSYKREYAYKLGVDVYSSNSVLQKELNRVGWASAVGSLGLSVITAPAQSPIVKVGKTMRLGQQINESLKEEPPSRLRIINSEKLSAMGISQELAEKYLDHPAFTPRHDVIIVESLANLTNAKGRDGFIQFALKAEDEESANFIQNMAETMRGYHDTVSPVSQVMIVSGVVVAKAKNGSVLIPFPLDHGVWSEQAERIITGLVSSIKAKLAPKKIELWITGTVSPLARQQLKKLEINVTENAVERIGFFD